MAKFTFLQIDNAYMQASFGTRWDSSVVICKDTGEILVRSDLAGIDEISEREDLDWDQCVQVPHKSEFGLGKRLVFDFVWEYLPADYDYVRRLFLRAGAYSRYKALLERRGLLDAWHRMERKREEESLRKWCQESGIELED